MSTDVRANMLPSDGMQRKNGTKQMEQDEVWVALIGEQNERLWHTIHTANSLADELLKSQYLQAHSNH